MKRERETKWEHLEMDEKTEGCGFIYVSGRKRIFLIPLFLLMFDTHTTYINIHTGCVSRQEAIANT